MQENKTLRIILVGLFVIVGLVILSNTAQVNQVKFDGEMVCNTGNIKINFEGKFLNEEWIDKSPFYTHNFTRYNTEFLPKKISLQGIEGLTCTFKYGGSMPRGFAEKYLNFLGRLQ